VVICLWLHEIYGTYRTAERIYGGTSEIMKTIIARDLTGLRT
jgi:alkylation response protein AidB-like acyl-CoA dehydrogenase